VAGSCVAVKKCCIKGGLDSTNDGRPDGGGGSRLATGRQEKEAK
jgi:hypothetical protein